MNALVVVKMLHLISLLLLLYASLVKNILLAPSGIRREALGKALRIDKLSAAAAGVMMLSGIAMLLWLGKPTIYYVQSPYFLLKMFIFIVASSLIVLTKIFLRQAFTNASAELIAVPQYVRWILRIDLLSVLLMAGLGWAVARGAF